MGGVFGYRPSRADESRRRAQLGKGLREGGGQQLSGVGGMGPWIAPPRLVVRRVLSREMEGIGQDSAVNDI
jgi:hypothetical protein